MPAPTRYGSQRRPRPEEHWRMSPMPAVDVAADVVRVVDLHARRARVRPAPRMRSRKPGAKRSTWASMRAVMSTVDPAGHVAIRPGRVLPGRRPRRIPRARTGRTARYGRSAMPAGSDLGLGRRRSRSSVPPRWTVAARRRSRGRPWHRPVQRPVDLEHARPVAEAARAAAVRGRAVGRRRWRATGAASCPAARRGRAAVGAMASTRCPVTISPPSVAQLRDQCVGDGR